MSAVSTICAGRKPKSKTFNGFFNSRLEMGLMAG